jgi:PKD repeat protein
MKKLIIGLLAACIVLTAISCARAPAPEPESSEPPSPTAPPAPVVVPSPEPRPTPTPTPAPTPAPPAEFEPYDESSAIDRMIVRTAQMAMVVDDVPATLEQITSLAEDAGGYVVSSQRWEEDEKRLAGTITIRVPAGDFGGIMTALRNLAIEVTHEETSSKDVTEEYVDLSAKLKNLEASEEQLIRLMEKAEKVEDILEIQRELSKTRGEIEQTKGRMQYLERTSATSLISVQLNEAGLDVSFTASKRVVKEGEKIRFESQVSGGFPPYSYEWDFGDGETSTGANPTHAYKAPGYYEVSLKVSDDRGNPGHRDREAYINVLAGWSPGNVASSAWNGLVIFGQVLANILIWLGIFSPVWIIGGGIFYWWWRRRRRKA